MNWNLAVEKNHGALKRILATLVAMIRIAGSNRPATLPRHLHRYLLRLLRPAEAATRRLIIIAARGLLVRAHPSATRKPQQQTPTSSGLDHFFGTMVPMPAELPQPAGSSVSSRVTSSVLSFSLLDPLKRSGVERYARLAVKPDDDLLGGNATFSFFRRPKSAPPPAPSPDDKLDAGHLMRRLAAIGHALENLPAQAERFARWQARRDEGFVQEWDSVSERSAAIPFAPPSVLPDISPTSGEISRGAEDADLHQQETRGGAEASDLPPCGGDVRQDRGGQRRAPYSDSAMQPCRRPRRIYPTRSNLPGWRRSYDVHAALNDVHGLAVRAAERRDSS